MSTPLSSSLDEQVRYDRDGLVPCVVQDWGTGEVLMLAYMNEQALQRTHDSGELHLWSRSRGEPWHKGATSGNTHHPIVKFTGSAKHRVKGVVFRVSAEELHNADTYEVAAYKRVAVTLGSRTRAWVYIDGRFVPPNP